MRFLITFAALMLALPVGAAAQSVVVLGSSDARICYNSANSDRFGRAGNISVCQRALDDQHLTRHDRAATYVNMGILLSRAGRLPEAFSAYDTAISLRSGLAEAWLNRGIARLGVRDWEEAEADFNQALALGVREPHKAYYHRALALDARERYPEAYADFQQALEIMPGWELPLQELERYQVVRGPAGG